MSTGYLVYELLAAQAGVLLVATVAVGLAALLVSLRLPGPPARARLDAEPGPRLVERPAWPRDATSPSPCPRGFPQARASRAGPTSAQLPRHRHPTAAGRLQRLGRDRAAHRAGPGGAAAADDRPAPRRPHPGRAATRDRRAPQAPRQAAGASPGRPAGPVSRARRRCARRVRLPAAAAAARAAPGDVRRLPRGAGIRLHRRALGRPARHYPAGRSPALAAGAGGRAGGTCHPVRVAGGPHRQARRSGDARAADRPGPLTRGRQPGAGSPGPAARGRHPSLEASHRLRESTGERMSMDGFDRINQAPPRRGPWRRSNWLPASSSPQLLWPRTAWYDTRWPSPAARRPREHASLPWKAVA